jgi:hypothetical protein
MSLNWTKERSANGTEVEVADLGNISKLDVRLEFQQKKSKGLMGKLKDNFQAADPDLVAFAWKGRTPVDYVEPKDRTTIYSGAVSHLGDGRKAGTETITFDLSRLRAEQGYVTAFGIGVVLNDAEGFSRIAGVVAHFYDVSTGQPQLLGSVPFSVLGRHTGASLGLLVKKPEGWKFVQVEETGHASDWQQLAALMRNHVTD